MVQRREFLGLVGVGGLASLLPVREAWAGELPCDFSALAGGSTAPLHAATVPYSQIAIVTGLKIDQRNIAGVRQAIQDMIPQASLDAMITNLVEARRRYAEGYIGDPPEAEALGQQILEWLPELAKVVPKGAAALQEPDRDPIDAWTLVHFLSGAFLGAVCLDFWTALRLLILWEIIEPHIWPGWNESLINQIMDVIAGMLGWYLAKEIKEKILKGQPQVEALPAAAGG